MRDNAVAIGPAAASQRLANLPVDPAPDLEEALLRIALRTSPAHKGTGPVISETKPRQKSTKLVQERYVQELRQLKGAR